MRCTSVVTLVLSLFFLFTPLFPARADFGLPFGGFTIYTVACTCPGSIGNLWISYDPLWFSDEPIAGALVYVPWLTQLFAWYNIEVPATYHLGSYIPGVQACWMLLPTTPPTCSPLPADGVITEVGTS